VILGALVRMDRGVVVRGVTSRVSASWSVGNIIFTG